MRPGRDSRPTRLVLPTLPPNTAGGRRTLILWAIAIEATNNRHMLETDASMFTEGDLAYVRAVRDEAETAHGPAFTLLPYFWSLMMRAATSEYYLPGAVPQHLYEACRPVRLAPSLTATNSTASPRNAKRL